jgi:hypothetical protein
LHQQARRLQAPYISFALAESVGNYLVERFRRAADNVLFEFQTDADGAVYLIAEPVVGFVSMPFQLRRSRQSL